MKAIINGRVVTATGKIFEKGAVLVEGGKITAVGDDLEIPAGTSVFDATGCWVVPGLIDCHSHISMFNMPTTDPGMKDGNEHSDPITPHLRAIDALNPFDAAIERVRRAGFTTCFILPGSANIIGGMGISIKLRGRTADEMAIPGTEQMKFALGENPKRFYGLNNKMPITRMGTAALLRETLSNAKAYSDQLSAYEVGKGEKPKFDFRLSALTKVITGEQKCRIHCHRSDDIMTAIRIAKEFGLDFTLEHATEGYKVADILSRERITCIVGPLLIPPVKMELWGMRQDTAAVLNKAGVKICLTADAMMETEWLPSEIGIVMRKGLPEASAFEAVTINAAEVLGLKHRLGSIEPGKDADIAVFNGHPFSNMTECILTMIDGEVYGDKRA